MAIGSTTAPTHALEVTGTASISGHLTLEGTTSTGSTGSNLLVFATTPTITTAVFAGGHTASGSGANDYSSSTGTFLTSTGANTLSGATTITDATTPSLTTASGKTNTGFVQVNGKTSGSLQITTADATAQAVTLTTAAQTTGASTITMPNTAGVSDTFAYVTLAQTLVNKTLTTPKITTINDANGNAFIASSATASAVDGITVTTAATANPATVTLASSGSDSNVNLTLNAKGTGLVGSSSFANFTANRVFMTADWTCGTGGTVSACTSATIIGSGGGTALTLTLPLQAASYRWHCHGVVGQATGATANSWNVITSTNAPTNLEAQYQMGDSATTFNGGALTGVSSTTTQVIGGTWTLGGTATKMPFDIEGTIEGASASGTVISLQLVAPTVADLVTIYRGAYCSVGAF